MSLLLDLLEGDLLKQFLYELEDEETINKIKAIILYSLLDLKIQVTDDEVQLILNEVT